MKMLDGYLNMAMNGNFNNVRKCFKLSKRLLSMSGKRKKALPRTR